MGSPSGSSQLGDPRPALAVGQRSVTGHATMGAGDVRHFSSLVGVRTTVACCATYRGDCRPRGVADQPEQAEAGSAQSHGWCGEDNVEPLMRPRAGSASYLTATRSGSPGASRPAMCGPGADDRGQSPLVSRCARSYRGRASRSRSRPRTSAGPGRRRFRPSLATTKFFDPYAVSSIEQSLLDALSR